MGVATPITFPLVLLIFFPAAGSPQDLTSEARALRPSDPSDLSRAADDDLERRAHDALDGIVRANSAKDIEEQRPRLRRRLEKSLGIKRLPWPPDLQVTLTGQVERDGYQIDKLVFQTLPGVWVPAHLYLPSPLTEAAPAVFLSSAHAWEEGKAHPDAQAFAINLSRMGFVLLVFDGIGQGERAGSPAGHRYSELRLVGVTQQALVQYETRCALRYLRSRRDVDPSRLGMAGTDGGGFATWIAAALDDDISVAVVIDDTTDFHGRIPYFRSLDGHELDDQHTLVPGIFRYANNHELLALVAPKPLLIVQSSSDESYSITGARTVRDYGTAIYTTLHERTRIAFVEDESNGRGLQKAKREAAYGWLLRWLAQSGNGKPIDEPDTDVRPADSPELAVLADGRTEPAEPGIDALVTGLAANAGGRTGSFQPDALLDEEPPRADWAIGLKPARISRHLGHVQPGIYVPWLALRPGPKGASPANGVLVAIDDRGKEELVSDPIVREAVEGRGWQVWAIDPRGIGEMQSPRAEWFYRTSLMLGEDLIWRQAFDIRWFLERANNFPSHLVALYTRGPGASLAGAYALALARPQPEIAVFRDGLLSFQEVWQSRRSNGSSSGGSNSEPASTLWGDAPPVHWFAQNVLEAGDVSGFLNARKGREFIISPLSGKTQTPGSADTASSPFRFVSVDEFITADWR